jgi:ankyrin repeat protein
MRLLKTFSHVGAYVLLAGQVNVCNTLIERGLKPSALDAKHNMPLHIAGMRGQGEVARLLMSKETSDETSDPLAILFVKNKAGICCWHLALMNDVRKGAGQEAALKLLENLGSHEGLNTPVADAKQGRSLRKMASNSTIIALYIGM